MGLSNEPTDRPIEPGPDEALKKNSACGNTMAALSDAAQWQLPPGRYQFVSELARGGMGVVLRVIDTDVQRPLAVKVLQQEGLTAVERFLEEARVTGQLQHPGIPPVHEIGRLADGRPFFSMKLIQGRTLSELLRERPTPQHHLPTFLKIFEQIAQTIAYAHAQRSLRKRPA